MRLRFIVFFVFILLNLFQNASAQRIPMPTTISTPRGNVTIYTPSHIPMYNNFNYKDSNRRHEFTIVFLNDSTMTVKAVIDLSDSVHCIEWGKKENQIIIKPSETKEIYRMVRGEKISGKAMDSCWIFSAGFGKINTYSVTSETDYPLIAYVQKGVDKPILPLTEANVREMVKDNGKALKLADRKKLLKAVEKYNEE